MSTPIAGKVSVVRIADKTGAAWNTSEKLKGRVDWNFNLDKTEIDAGHMDIVDGWSAFLQGRKNGTISGTLRYIEVDPGQVILINNAYGDGDRIWLQWAFDPAETPYSSRGFVTNINPSPSDEDVTNMSFSIRIDDSVANSAVSLPDCQVSTAGGVGSATIDMVVKDVDDDPVEGFDHANFSCSIDGGPVDTFENHTEFGAVTYAGGSYEVTFTAAAGTYLLTDIRAEGALIAESLEVVLT